MVSTNSKLLAPKRGTTGGPAPLQFGDVEILRLVESEFPILDPFEIYPDATPATIAAELPWLAPRFYDTTSKRLILAFQGFLLRVNGKIILVDTCVGDCKRRVRADFDNQRWEWPARLAETGVRPEDIDYVVCSHMHVDHVGWNTRLENGRWIPMFPNARYLFARAEWEYWKGSGVATLSRTGDYMQDSVLPVMAAGLVDLVETDHIIDGAVRLQPAPGHTPGLVTVGIESRNQRAVLASDVLHTPLQCRFPHWSTRFCADADRSRATRTAFLERYAGTDVTILPAHFPAPTAGFITRQGGGFGFHFFGEENAIYQS